MPTVFPATEPAWALRAYLVLIGCAYRSETITYGELAGAVNRGGPNLLAGPLNCLARWCTRNGLPQIASLVIDLATAMPAPDFTAVERDAIRSEQEKVWTYDWFSILPPTIAELSQKVN
jgi:hypothetical protein